MAFSEKKQGQRSLSDFSGNTAALAQARAWADSWAKGERQPPLLLHGPTGTGKTLLAHALANDYSWDLFEFNASSFRDEESVAKLLSHAANSNSLFGGLRLILIDDVDSLSGSADRGGGGAIAKILSSSSQPILLTARDLYDRKLSSIKTHCTPIEIRRLHPSSIAALVKKEAARLGIAITQENADSIAKAVGGDARAALNDLAAGNFSSFRDREKNIFEVVRTILKSGKYSEARQAAFSSEVDHDTLKLWVAHNIPSEMKTPFEISEAYNAISRADIFDGRIKRAQYWGYLRYSGDLLSAGVALSKESEHHGFNMTTFPDYLRAMGASKGSRQVRKAVLSKIARECHCSVPQAQTYLWHLREISKTDAPALERIYKFDEDELAYISGTAPKGGKKAATAKKAKK